VFDSNYVCICIIRAASLVNVPAYPQSPLWDWKFTTVSYYCTAICLTVDIMASFFFVFVVSVDRGDRLHLIFSTAAHFRSLPHDMKMSSMHLCAGPQDDVYPQWTPAQLVFSASSDGVTNNVEKFNVFCRLDAGHECGGQTDVSYWREIHRTLQKRDAIK